MSERVLTVTDENFERDVLQAGQPVVVDFGAPWCPPCRALEPVFEELAGRFEGGVRFFKMNIDENPSTPQRYGIKGIPTLIFFSGGKEASASSARPAKEALAASSASTRAPRRPDDCGLRLRIADS